MQFQSYLSFSEIASELVSCFHLYSDDMWFTFSQDLHWQTDRHMNNLIRDVIALFNCLNYSQKKQKQNKKNCSLA